MNLKEVFFYFQNLTSRKQANITTQLQTHSTLTGKKKRDDSVGRTQILQVDSWATEYATISGP